ncbi:MAG: 3-oxoacyl-[acyl-carrier-protein] synthase III C-terminal domain-containing protein [Chitinophagaceae bacterium]
MGSQITSMFADYGPGALNDVSLKKNSVYHLACQALQQVADEEMHYSHLLAVTSCPDAIAPSLGQCLTQHYHHLLGRSHTVDIVQGCTGGVSALILASQLSDFNKSHILVVASDAAQKATSPASEVFNVFNNGVFACCVSYSTDHRKLVHHQTRQYKGLHDVVKIGLGHDADAIIAGNAAGIMTDSRKYLGLQLNNQLALRLMKEAEGFYLEFTAATGHPDILILHQVNELIIDHLQHVFAKYPAKFINQAKQTGNCGSATTGIVLHHIKNEIDGKKVMICSFGTGGIITAGLWQF